MTTTPTNEQGITPQQILDRCRMVRAALRKNLTRLATDDIDALIRALDAAPYVHAKGRSCERTEQVLNNYKRRALVAEEAIWRQRED